MWSKYLSHVGKDESGKKKSSWRWTAKRVPEIEKPHIQGPGRTIAASTGIRDEVVGRLAEQLPVSPASKDEWGPQDGNNAPMKLCSLCSKLNMDLLSKHDFLDPGIKHQPSFTALETSASTGCEMCSMFLECVTISYCEENKCSSNEAYQIFRNVGPPAQVSCWLKPEWDSSKIREISYWIPHSFKKGNMNMMGNFRARGLLDLMNCQGVCDERLYQTELAPLPDFSIARRWVQACTDSHQKCSMKHNGHQASETQYPRPDFPRLPTRVLDVGLDCGEEPRLLISGNRTAAYVTLSHCWGKVRPMVTNSSNLLQHLQSIPLSSMPRTFQDAVIATRELRFRFLWIDSLCIIQDSPEDWERECSNMAHIYQNSAVNICGPTASDSYAGFLHARAPPEGAAYLWEYRNAKGDARRATFRLPSSHPGYDHPYWSKLIYKEQFSPLQQRGWILQEYLLSPRLLFFGSYRMYWECNTYIQFENLNITKESSDAGLHCTVGKASIVPVDFAGQTLQWKKWYSVVQEYSLRSLTESRDKLPALSGVADWILGGRGDEYLAGLLKHALHAGLTWHIPSDSNLKQQVSGYRGPSWSWCSTDYPVTFSALKPHTSDGSGGDEKARRRMYDSTSRKTKMDVHDTHVELLGQNPFGEVKSGSIKLKGRVKIGLVTWTRTYSTYAPLHLRHPITEALTGHFFPDDLHRWRQIVEEQNRPKVVVGRQLDEKTDSPSSVTANGKEDSHDASSSSTFVESLRRQSIRLREIECLCIDVFDNGWLALAIEPLSLEHLPPRPELASRNEIYKPYRRIGALDFWPVKSADLHWFQDGQWELIELF